MKNRVLCYLCLMLASFSMVCTNNASEKNNGMSGHKEVQMSHENHAPQYLYKIVSPEEWEASLLKNEVVTSPLDNNFIHLATEEQVDHVAQKFWKDKSYIILKLDSKKISGRLIYETNPGGTTHYYHLYEGKIPLDAVVEVSKVNN